MGWPYNGNKNNSNVALGHFFAPSAGIEPESVKDDLNPRRTKAIKAVKICVAILIIAAIAVIGYFIVKDVGWQ